MVRSTKYKCVKCHSDDFETGEVRTAGGLWTKIFDIQNLKFDRVTCKKCGYTEIYKKGTHVVENIFDFFTN